MNETYPSQSAVWTRGVHVADVTAHPDRAWVAQQAHNTAMFFGEQEVKPQVLLWDNDGMYGPGFDAVFASEGVAVNSGSPRHRPTLTRGPSAGCRR